MAIADRDSVRYRVITEGATASTLSRRTFLAATLATGILSTLPASRSVASQSLPHADRHADGGQV